MRETGVKPDPDIGLFLNGRNRLDKKAGLDVPPAIGASGIATRIDACKDRVDFRGKGRNHVLNRRPCPREVMQRRQ